MRLCSPYCGASFSPSAKVHPGRSLSRRSVIVVVVVVGVGMEGDVRGSDVLGCVRGSSGGVDKGAGAAGLHRAAAIGAGCGGAPCHCCRPEKQKSGSYVAVIVVVIVVGGGDADMTPNFPGRHPS